MINKNTTRNITVPSTFLGVFAQVNGEGTYPTPDWDKRNIPDGLELKSWNPPTGVAANYPYALGEATWEYDPQLWVVHPLMKAAGF